MSSNSRLDKCPNDINPTGQPEEKGGRASFKGCDLCSYTGTRAQRGPCLVYCSSVSVFKFLIFEQGAQHFRFSLGPVNYVAGPEWK